MTPVAVERLLAGTGRFNVGFAAVMTVQGVGASLSNVIAGAVVSARGYQAAHLLSGLIAVTAIALFLCYYVGWPTGTKMNMVFGEVIKKHRNAQK